jgi:hypothetical protein
MAEKRSRKTEEEAKEHKANDVLRRKAGKVKMMPPTIETSCVLMTRDLTGHEQDQRRFESKGSHKGG